MLTDKFSYILTTNRYTQTMYLVHTPIVYYTTPSNTHTPPNTPHTHTYTHTNTHMVYLY